LLRAGGIRTIGIDINPEIVGIAQRQSVDLALKRQTDGIENKIFEFTSGIGCDAVIITAATQSLDPINLAGGIARKKGTVVVVGDVPTGFDREPHYYKKELQVRMSCSYGPGRYDPTYEERGIDYPAGHVRWTENRNMQAFQELIHSRKIDVSYLTTHILKLEDAPTAYDMMLDRSEPILGILIKYDIRKKTSDKPLFCSKPKTQRVRKSKVTIGFIGAGSYAQSHLLPNIPTGKDSILKGVLTSTGASSRSVAERFGFEFCTANQRDIFENEEINTVFIVSRHDSHADYVIKALKSRKHVFVEKPLCLSDEELGQIVELLNIKTVKDSASTHQSQYSLPILMVGYNRRFSPLAKFIKEKFSEGPMAITYRVNAGAIPPDSWIQDQDIGGGRILGEVCHFVDFLTYISGSLPKSVYAIVLSEPNHLKDTLNVSLLYENGSIGTISYFANGDKSLPKERIEVFANGCSAVIEDFKSLSFYAGGKKTTKKLLSQNKGQKDEVRIFLDTIISGGENPIPFDEIYSTSLVTFKIIESIRTGKSILL
jgi:polar amino acid transport system substrate-binding protein